MRKGSAGKRSGLKAALAALPLGAAWALGPAAIPARGETTAASAPSWVEAHRPFTLAMTGESPLCAPVFSHPEVRLADGKLVLSVLMQERIGVLCIDVPSFPYRAEFAVPALDTGSYAVQVRWRQACEFDPAPCPVAYNPKDIGTLQVTDSAHLAYHIASHSAPAEKAFPLLLKGDFRCGDRITAQSVDTTARPSLLLNFTIERGSASCDTIVPGLEFRIPPLAAGVWQVYAWRTPYCPPGGLCPVLTPAPSLAGALAVEASPDPIVPWRSGSRPAPAPRGTNFHAEWNGMLRDAIGRRAAPSPSSSPRIKAGFANGNLPSGATP